jgi:NADH:ubiquinone oxidoreductase subunit K
VTLTYALVVAAALFAFGLGSFVGRRTMLGALLAFELMMASAILAVAAITTLSGAQSAQGQVVAVVLVGAATAAGVLVLGAYLASAAGDGTDDEGAPGS